MTSNRLPCTFSICHQQTMDGTTLTHVTATVTESVSAVTYEESLYGPRHIAQEQGFLQKGLFLIKCSIAIQFPSWLKDCLF